MIILGIETSCDETAAAVVEGGTKILSNIVSSSVELHKKTGGIIPEVAAREQLRCIMPVIQEALFRVKEQESRRVKIDAIAVTVGPGLIGSLLVGVETAKTLAYLWEKPIIPINHLQAHLYANWLYNSKSVGTPQFPTIGLVVSGGHTDLVLMKNHPSKGRGKLRWLGGTRDDAAGECFDKCARLLGLGYPGGPAISKAGEQFTINHQPLAIKLPRPMINENNFDFSFSGLKTAVLRIMKEKEVANFSSRQRRINSANPFVSALAFEIQEAITDVLVTKTFRAAEKYKVKSILLAGGVAANKRLRAKFSSQLRITNYQLLIPPPSLCTDNAAMVASCAYFNFHPLPWQKIQANPSLEIEEMVK